MLTVLERTALGVQGDRGVGRRGVDLLVHLGEWRGLVDDDADRVGDLEPLGEFRDDRGDLGGVVA
jgi:hypothetical protein